MKRLTFKSKAVIFDMDGVIVDSMPHHKGLSRGCI